jgi:hypothetical protein
VLYKADGNRALKAIRTVVNGTGGVYDVEASEDGVISVAYPHIVPKALSIIHQDEPERVDEVVINPDAKIVIDSLNCLRNSSPYSVRLLFSLLTTPGTLDVRVEGVRISPSADSEPRVSDGRSGDYAQLVVPGLPGGAATGAMMFASREGNDLVLRVGSERVILDRLPPGLDSREGIRRIGIVAANRQYLVIANYDGPPGSSTMFYIHNRISGVWTTVTVPGDNSRVRLFGNWLASIVQTAHMGNATNPGRDQERAISLPNRPNVRMDYRIGRGLTSDIPGVLELDNLKDHRRIVIKTGQEDSEVLSVAPPEIVVYRVNDSIYQASIIDGALQNASIVAKDANVPEIHWSFLSPQ